MRDPQRMFPMAQQIMTLWNFYPDMRFFQLMHYIESSVKEMSGKNNLFYMEDDEIKKYLEKMISGK